ncbi:hypothetical protein MMC14_000250 [Varicellaria rhodocarpa]|nr:hypothetical protein [Varicellaria rhodocarpa]
MPYNQDSTIVFGILFVIPLVVFGIEKIKSRLIIDKSNTTAENKEATNDEVFVLTENEIKNVLQYETRLRAEALREDGFQDEPTKELERWNKFWTQNAPSIKRRFKRLVATQSSRPCLSPQNQDKGHDKDHELNDYLAEHQDIIYREATLLAAERLTAIKPWRPLRESQMVDAMRFGFDTAFRGAMLRFENLRSAEGSEGRRGMDLIRHSHLEEK